MNNKIITSSGKLAATFFAWLNRAMLIVALLFSASVWAQNVPPLVSITGPTTSTLTLGAPAVFVLTAHATDSDGTIAYVEFSYSSSVGSGTGGTDSLGGGDYTTTWGSVGVGTYTVTAIAHDNSGAVTTSAPIVITVVPNTPPTVSMTGPTTLTYGAPASFTASAHAADSDGTVSSLKFFYSSANNSGSSDASNLGGGNFSVTWGGVIAGTYTITAVAYDNSGGVTTSAPIIVTVNPNTPPTVSMTGPTTLSYVAPASFTASAHAADSDGTVASVAFVYSSANNSGSSGANNLGGGNFSITWGGVIAGTYTISAVAYDNSGGSTTSAPITVNVYASAPPTVGITAPAGNTPFAPGASIPLRASAADSDGTVTQVQFFNGATLIGSATLGSGSAASGNWISNAWTNVPAGTYSITAKATDNTGGVVTSSPVTVVVDPSAATTVSVAGAPPGVTYTAPATIPLTASAANNAYGITAVRFYNGATLIGEGLLTSGSASSGSYVTNAWTNVAAGTYTITAVATDASGGSAVSSPVSYTVGAASAGAGVGLYFIDTDHLNTPRLVENQSQQAVWKWDQAEPFGDSVPNENPSNLGAFKFDLRYPGQVADAETGTNYNFFRDYSPSDGKYKESDPIGLKGGLATYSYASNSPIELVDPTGRAAAIPIPGPVGGAAAAAALNAPVGGLVASGAAGAATVVGGVAIAGAGGWYFGTYVIYPLVEQPLANVIDACMASESKRCQKVREKCIEDCSKKTLPTRNDGWNFFNCVATCMENNGCKRGTAGDKRWP